MSDPIIFDEHGQPINQLETIKPHIVLPLLSAFFKVAYEYDPEFKSIIDEFANSVNEIVKELDT